jgi:hypothetical protein
VASIAENPSKQIKEHKALQEGNERSDEGDKERLLLLLRGGEGRDAREQTDLGDEEQRRKSAMDDEDEGEP